MLSLEVQHQPCLLSTSVHVPQVTGHSGHIVGPNLGQKPGGQALHSRPGPYWMLYHPETKLGKIIHPGSTPYARSDGDPAVMRGRNAGAVSTLFSSCSQLEPSAPSPDSSRRSSRRSPTAPMPSAARPDPNPWLAAPPSLAPSSVALTIPKPGRWSR